MGILRIYEKSGKQKRKPGWAKAQAEHDAWLAGIKAMSSGVKPKSKLVLVKKIKPETPAEREAKRAKYVVGGSGKPVDRPDLLYRDNPEMLERELMIEPEHLPILRRRTLGIDPSTWGVDVGGRQIEPGELVLLSVKSSPT